MDERTQSPKSSPAAAKLKALQLETAIKALAKLLVSIKFYPSGHPSLRDLTSDVTLAFAPLLQGQESVAVVVRRSGFFYEEEPVGSANAMMQKFAASLFSRKIQRLTILKDLSSQDLWEAARIFLLDVDVILKEGGIPSLLQRAKVTTIWANAVDLKGIFELKSQIEAEQACLAGSSELPAAEALPPLGETSATQVKDDRASAPALLAGELTFEALLFAVEMASDDQEFAGLLQRLIPVVLENLTENSAHLVLQTLSLLVQYSASDHSSEEKRKAAQRGMVELSSPELLDFYINILCSRVRMTDHRIVLEKISQTLGDPLAKLLLARLADEDDRVGRRALLDALISQGKGAFSAIVATLQEDRWSVLRNAAYLLGELRDPAAIDPLRALLRHRDLRVRREALRAMTRIGGHSVIAIVAKILQEDDGDLRRQAMLCLGATKNPATIPLLVQFLKQKDWRFLQLEVKLDAISALGEIGSADALPALMEVASNRCLFYRRSNDELRAAAIMAIGEIGGSEAIDYLEAMAAVASHTVAKAVASAIKQARKGSRCD